MYKVILALRYLFGRRISYLALTAVAVCVFIVVVVMTVMTGLVSDFKNKNHNFVGDCIISTDSLVGFAYYQDFLDKLKLQNDLAEGASAVIRSYALVSPSSGEQNIGFETMGIDPATYSNVTGFSQMLYYNRDKPLDAFKPDYGPNLPGCVVGIDRILERNPDGSYPYEAYPVRRELRISIFPLTVKGALAKAGGGEVNTKTFYYSDMVQTGLARTDNSLIYLPFDDAQKLCGMDLPVKRASAIQIKFKPGVKLDDGCSKVKSLWVQFVKEKTGENYADLFGTVAVQSWKEYRRAFIAPMEKEQIMLSVMFLLVGLTTVFIVFVVFYMVISHKSKDIGILKSVGASSGNIVQLFLGYAFMLGVFGSAAGSVCGWQFLVHINEIEDWLFRHFGFQLWNRTIYAIGSIPNTLDLKVLGVIIISAIAACLLGAFIPSWQAARMKPVETLQVSQL